MAAAVALALLESGDASRCGGAAIQGEFFLCDARRVGRVGRGKITFRFTFFFFPGRVL
jgi:hypothetical protein